MATSNIEHPRVVSRKEWLAARKELLAKEKQLTRQRDVVSAQRRELPWLQEVDSNEAFKLDQQVSPDLRSRFLGV